jgi:hypothetical protein
MAYSESHLSKADPMGALSLVRQQARLEVDQFEHQVMTKPMGVVRVGPGQYVMKQSASTPQLPYIYNAAKKNRPRPFPAVAVGAVRPEFPGKQGLFRADFQQPDAEYRRDQISTPALLDKLTAKRAANGHGSVERVFARQDFAREQISTAALMNKLDSKRSAKIRGDYAGSPRQKTVPRKRDATQGQRFPKLGASRTGLKVSPERKRRRKAAKKPVQPQLTEDEAARLIQKGLIKKVSKTAETIRQVIQHSKHAVVVQTHIRRFLAIKQAAFIKKTSTKKGFEVRTWDKVKSRMVDVLNSQNQVTREQKRKAAMKRMTVRTKKNSLSSNSKKPATPTRKPNRRQSVVMLENDPGGLEVIFQHRERDVMYAGNFLICGKCAHVRCFVVGHRQPAPLRSSKDASRLNKRGSINPTRRGSNLAKSSDFGKSSEELAEAALQQQREELKALPPPHLVMVISYYTERQKNYALVINEKEWFRTGYGRWHTLSDKAKTSLCRVVAEELCNPETLSTTRLLRTACSQCMLEDSEEQVLTKQYQEMDFDYSGSIDFREFLRYYHMDEKYTHFVGHLFGMFNSARESAIAHQGRRPSDIDLSWAGKQQLRQVGFVCGLVLYCTSSYDEVAEIVFSEAFRGGSHLSGEAAETEEEVHLGRRHSVGGHLHRMQLDEDELEHVMCIVHSCAHSSDPMSSARAGGRTLADVADLADVLKTKMSYPIDLATFKQQCREWPTLLSPAFELQEKLRDKIMGFSWWKTYRERLMKEVDVRALRGEGKTVLGMLRHIEQKLHSEDGGGTTIDVKNILKDVNAIDTKQRADKALGRARKKSRGGRRSVAAVRAVMATTQVSSRRSSSVSTVASSTASFATEEVSQGRHVRIASVDSQL